MRPARVLATAIFLLCGSLIFTSEISRDIALNQSLERSPKIQSSSINAQAWSEFHNHSGLFSNPALSIELDNWLGSGNYRGLQALEITYGISQVFELGGKRARRVELAKQNLDTAKLEVIEKKLDIIRDTSICYANAVYAQEFLILASEQKSLADDVFKEVVTRVSSAREPMLQENKAAITLFAANFDYERAQKELSLAKHRLANQWNGHEEDFTLNASEFFQITAPLIEKQAEDTLPKNPILKMAQAQVSVASAHYELEKSSGFFDLTVNFGLRQHLGSRDFAFIAGISLPLSLFNRNLAASTQAQVLIKKAKVDVQTVQNELVLATHEQLKNIEEFYSKALNLKNNILPAALKSFSLAREAYSSGKLPYYEVLDAQRTLSQVKEQYLSALRDYHIANAEIERLTAKHSDRPLVQEDGKNDK